MKDKYAVTYLDKAGQNMVFMCKKLYLDLVNRQLFGNTVSGTYIISELNRMQAIATFDEAVGEYKLPCTKKDVSLPYLFLIVKAHKTPIKFCTIISSRNLYIEVSGRFIAESFIERRYLGYTHKAVIWLPINTLSNGKQ